jgi:hypothetical protein
MMHVADVLLRSTLKRAALRYADRGWPVIPGAILARDRYVCGPLCPTVACHPAVVDWERAASADVSDVDSWWASSPFSVLFPTGHAFDVIEVPPGLGEITARVCRLAPVAAAPAGQWLFFVAAGHSLRPELASRLDIILHGRGSWVSAPPSRTRSGRWRWYQHPAETAWRLPDPYAVQKKLLEHLDSPRHRLARLDRAA